MKKRRYQMEYHSHQYKSLNSIKERRIGNWIVVLEPCGIERKICIYNLQTGQEHYRLPTLVTPWEHIENVEIQNFYKKIEERNFQHVCSIAESME